MALTDPTVGRKVGRRGRRHGAPGLLTVVPGGAATTPASVELAQVNGTVISVPALDRPRSVPGATTAADAPAGLADDVESTLEFNVREFREAATRSPRPAVQPGRSARRTWSDRYARRLFVTDLVCVLWAGLGVHLFEPPIPTRVSSAPGDVWFVVATAFLVVVWLLALAWSGSRDGTVTGHGPSEYKRVIQASVSVFGLAAIGSFLFDLDLPRSYVILMLPAGLVALLATRYLWRRWLFRRRDVGDMMSKVVAVGDRHAVGELLADLARAPRAGYRVVGVCVTDGRAARDDLDGVPVLGVPSEVAAVATSIGADAVAVTSSAAFGPSAVRRLSWDLEGTDTELILAPALTNIAGPRVHTQPVAGLPLIHVDHPTYRGANRIVKRLFDLFGSLSLVALFSPVLLAVAVAIKVTSKGPVFFRQDRVGINGETFRMIKFRSMVVDAEKRLDALKQEKTADAGNQVLFKMKNDPRITTVGRFIRRFSIDELPQLFNVVVGDMSLVGPRPPLRAEVDLYGDDALRRLLVKPGMTGLWQVSGRSDLTWDDSVRLDVYYVENWSITGDLAILWRTARAVLGSSGAY
ncbi:sugar transferase [Nakamurella sp.]|uniref:sugar transferase n=1 Tax=Nakamurella sp. TaxID=1869182 RepID=UPI003784B7AD